MAIDWSIEGCLPVSLDEVLAAAWDVVAAMVEVRPDDVVVESADDTMAEERAADERSFRAYVTGTITGEPFQLTLSMYPDMDARQRWIRTEDDASGSVESDRMDGSVTLGLATAIAWFKIAGGTLSGSGLRNAYYQTDVDELIAACRHPEVPPADRLALVREQVWHLRIDS
jgi:hypothetical protein